MSETLDDFKAGVETLEETTRSAIEISERNIGIIHTGRQRRALFVFSKLIVHNMAILGLADQFLREPETGPMLDHFSMAALARASIDTALMTMYISEPSLTFTTWDFRRQILFLHDLINRHRFLKPLVKQGHSFEYYQNYEPLKKELEDKITALGAQLMYGEEKLAQMRNGMTIFVEGARGAVREAGWNVDTYDFQQAYFSAFVHAHPVSFIQAFDQGVTFSGASEYQRALGTLIVESVSGYTASVNERMDTFSNPDTGDPIGHLE